MEFRILGPLEVWDEGQPVHVGGAKEQTLLAALLLNANEPVSTDRLIDELWGDHPPATARKSVQVRVAGLRRALHDSVLLSRSGGYLIRLDADQLDLHDFERLLGDGRRALLDGDSETAARTLREALALWRGPALADFAHESFAQPAIARLDELRLYAVELRLDAELALGLHAQLVGELRELIATHPLRERLYGQLMLALYRDGRQAEALDVYQRTRDQLVAELAIEPGPALRQLQQAILRQQPSLDLSIATPDRSILIAPQDAGQLDALVVLAESLATRPKRELILAQLIPESADVTRTAALLNERRQALLARGIAVRAVTFTSAAAGDDLVRIALEQDVDLLLVDGGSDASGSAVLETLLARAPCDVAVHIGRQDPPLEGPVLVLFGGGDHDWTAVEIGAWIAGARGTSLRLAGPRPARGRDASRALASASLAVQRVFGIPTEPVVIAPAEADVLAAAADAVVVVVGMPERWSQGGLGSVRTALAANARPPVLLVRRGLRPGGLAPRESLTRFTWTLGPAA
ncbi:MAG: winged helix-turn-helix domain-containing protein [Actinomycetota bacterium]|nr:winged helix-turn-helix domain-containing protein [Actinomycetota bacterium]